MEQIITNLGFPIACVCGCAYFIWNTTQQAREDNKERENRLYNQLEKFGEAMEKFNDTLIKIDTRLGAVEKELNGG